MIMSGLADKHIVITRAPHQADALAEQSRAQGAVPVLFPCIDIALPPDVTPLDDALTHLASFDWLVLTSVNTVHIVTQRLETLGIIPNWSSVRVAAIGRKTACSTMQLLGVTPDVVPDEQISEGLAEAIDVRHCERVLLPQSNLARPTLAQLLCARGAHVVPVEAYRTIVGSGGDDVASMLQAGQVDMLTFTSASTARNFVERVPDAINFGVPVACIGPTAAEAAHEVGFQVVLTPQHYSLEGLFQLIQEHFGD